MKSPVERPGFFVGLLALVVPAKAGTHNHKCAFVPQLWLQLVSTFDIGGYGSRIALRLSGTTSLEYPDGDPGFHAARRSGMTKLECAARDARFALRRDRG